MSKLNVTFDGTTITIVNEKKKPNEKDFFQVDINMMDIDSDYNSRVITYNSKQWNKVFLWEPLDEEGLTYLLVYTKERVVRYSKGRPEFILKKLLKMQHHVTKLKMTKRGIKVKLFANICNQYSQLEIEDMAIGLSDCAEVKCDITQVNGMPLGLFARYNPKNYRKVFIPMDKILEDPDINNILQIRFKTMGIQMGYGIAKKKFRVPMAKEYFAPLNRIFFKSKNLVLILRRNNRGVITLVKRFIDPYELTGTYRFWESKPVSWFLYHFGHFMIKHSKKKVNLFYEKETAKAEEGAFNVFELTLNEKGSDNYFIIDKDSDDYQKIKDTKNVIPKYSPKYYWLLYRANAIISTEAASHLNILRSANRYLRLKMVEYEFVFLQHGVTYMKRHEKASAFVENREAHPDYIFVGSQKEQDIVADMLKMQEKRILITGLPIFSTIEYKHIEQSSDDYVTIMLTFKPYEETLDDFQNSRYYKAIIDLYDIAKKYVPEDKILIVAHPRIQYLLETTDLKERMWQKPVSEVLAITKLMVTDYSSVAYNSFYQGSGVIYYQEDLMEYELACGQLIPTADEYIGYRAFSLEDFDSIMSELTEEGHIIMSRARLKKHEENYALINQFSDGKNAQRIYDELIKNGLI